MLKQYIAHNSLMPFYLNWQLKPNSGNYNLCFSYQLKSNKEAELLKKKTQELIRSKAYLRQTFSLENGKLIATIHEELPADINFLTSSNTEFSKLEEQLIKQPHNLNTGSSIRLNIINFNDCDICVALFNIHHIIIDGISLDNFVTDLNQLLENEQIIQENSDDYILRLTQEASIQELDKGCFAEDYISQLNAIVDDLNFFPVNDGENNFHYVDILPDNILQKLELFRQKNSASIFNSLLLAQGIFLSKLFNQNFSLLHYPVDVRRDKALNGSFVNLVALPLTWGANDSYLSLINILNNKIPFLKSVSKIKLNGMPNIDSIPSFAASNFAQPYSLIIHGNHYIAKSYPQLGSSILSIKYRELSGKLYFSCDVAIEILPENLARSLLSRFFHYLNKLLSDPAGPLATTDLTFLEERNQLLYAFNDTCCFYPKDKMIHQLFEEQAEKTPDSIVLIYENHRLTYSELNHRANQLAHYLINQYQIKPDDLIVLFLDRNIDMLIAMLAILKAGGAYVSLNLNSHNERTKYILEESKSRIVITNYQIQDKINQFANPFDQISYIAIDHGEIRVKLEQQLTTNVITRATSANLAHVIYTSGTTGLPKGVMIEHRNVVSLVKNVTYFHANELDTFALFSDVTFDAATFEIWGALLNGAKLFIPSNSLELLSNTERFKEILAENQITILWLTKTLFDQLFYSDESIFSKLNYLLVGGESLNKCLIYKLSASRHKPVNLINGYGPTENTTFSCTYNIQMDNISGLKSIPIGTPLSNKVAYVLDSYLNLLPIGAVGELYVGGAGLARGYLNQSTLSSEKFIINPFQTKKEKVKDENCRLYKTGDLARVLADGNLEYLGRNDFQVKIRGYRVELREIENRLMNYPEIKQAVVLETKRSQNDRIDQYLIAYYVSDNKLDALNLRNYLAAYLPDYILPRGFVHLAEFPKTISGKLDRKSLPAPEFFNFNEYVAPSNAKQKSICEAFSKVLDIERIGIKDDFFCLGGNSIKAIELSAILNTSFKVAVSDIFNMRSPEKISTTINFSDNNLKQKIEKIKLFFRDTKNEISLDQKSKEKLDQYLSSVQKAKYFFHKKSISNILLTGATGYLGNNILHQLLKLTDYNIYLLVRATSSEKAFDRVNEKFKFYFDETLNDVHNSRLFVFASNIEKSNLGLSDANYQILTQSIDSIVHAAALTKHYGDHDKFYSANVQATINLLELSKLTTLKDFHHVSTISVLDNNCNTQGFFTENDLLENLDNQTNIYIKTKHEAEKQVIKFRKQGVDASIYRVGNLAFISTNFRVQENIEDNAFFSRMKCLVTLKTIAQEVSIEEISPVDLTAQAIIKLLDKKQLSNTIHHVFNPNLCNIGDFFAQQEFMSVKISPINDFLDVLARYLNKPNVQNNPVMRFLLHQGWLDKEPQFQITKCILQDRTNAVLDQLGFKWPKITAEVFCAFIKRAYLY
jgi:amino acid adenylation domain-containing protein/thioester reductase-like protein